MAISVYCSDYSASLSIYPCFSRFYSEFPYVTATGEHYHFSGTCNGGTYYEASLAEAMGRGLTPCDKCVLTIANRNTDPAQPTNPVVPDQTPDNAPVSTPGTAPSENTGTPSTSTNPGNSDNFNTYDNEDQQQTSSQWVLNTSSKKIHYPSCSQVKKIAPQNYSTSNLSESELIAQGYTTCGVCHK